MSEAERTRIPMFPLGMALLPGELLPLQIFEPRYRTMLTDCLAMPRPHFGVVLIARGHELGGGDQRHMIATDADIVEHRVADDRRAVLRCVGGERLRVIEWLPDDPYPTATVQVFPDDEIVSVGAAPLEAQYAQVAASIEELFALVRSADRGSGGLGSGNLGSGAQTPTFDDTDYGLVDRSFSWAGQLPLGEADRLALLSAPSPLERIEVLAEAVDSVTAAIRFQLTD